MLAGGTGSTKLVRGLALVLDQVQGDKTLTIISNVGDNIWLHGLYVCPDIDTVIYGLAGMLDEKQGWGIKDDSFSFLGQLEILGAEAWFKLGDKDLATHVLRTAMMRQGNKLSTITEWMRKKYNVSAKIIPSTDDNVITKIVSRKNRCNLNRSTKNNGKTIMHLQEFWVKHKGEPEVFDIRYFGARKARANRSAIRAIRTSELIVIAPANPITSIGPIIAVPALRKELANVRKKVIAISPIIAESAITGPAIKYMQALNIESSPFGVAKYYSDFVGKFVISTSDSHYSEKISRLGMEVLHTDILMKNIEDEKRLATFLIEKTK